MQGEYFSQRCEIDIAAYHVGMASYFACPNRITIFDFLINAMSLYECYAQPLPVFTTTTTTTTTAAAAAATTTTTTNTIPHYWFNYLLLPPHVSPTESKLRPVIDSDPAPAPAQIQALSQTLLCLPVHSYTFQHWTCRITTHWCLHQRILPFHLQRTVAEM